MKRINTPITKKDLGALKSGDEFLLNGVIYTARDQAHKRLIALIKRGKKLPIDLKDQIIYYCGPTERPKAKIIGSCGPTTSSRMDELTIPLLKLGLRGMIGKGRRSSGVIKAIKRYGALYLLTYAGCAALLSEKVIEARAVAFYDLGPEAIYRLEVRDFPVIVGVSPHGKNIYNS
jgi:fumarate hydratase subunit beta